MRHLAFVADPVGRACEITVRRRRDVSQIVSRQTLDESLSSQRRRRSIEVAGVARFVRTNADAGGRADDDYALVTHISSIRGYIKTASPVTYEVYYDGYIAMDLPDPQFGKLVGGRLCLDFVNTVRGRIPTPAGEGTTPAVSSASDSIPMPHCCAGAA